MVDAERKAYEEQIAHLTKEHIVLADELKIAKTKNRELELEVAKLQGRVDAFMFCITGGNSCIGGIE